MISLLTTEQILISQYIIITLCQYINSHKPTATVHLLVQINVK